MEVFAKPENELEIPEGLSREDRQYCRRITHELATCLAKKRKGQRMSWSDLTFLCWNWQAALGWLTRPSSLCSELDEMGPTLHVKTARLIQDAIIISILFEKGTSWLMIGRLVRSIARISSGDFSQPADYCHLCWWQSCRSIFQIFTWNPMTGSCNADLSCHQTLDGVADT